MSTAETRPIIRPRPYRLWLRRFAVAGVALLGLLAGYLWLDRRLEERAWREACAEADRLDPGWRWDDLLAARPNPPDDRNAAVRVRTVKQMLPSTWGTGTQTLDRSLSSLARNQRPDPSQVAALRASLAAVAEALAKAEGLEDLSGGRLPREYRSPLLIDFVRDMLPDIQERREVTYLLRLYVTLLAEDGRADDALTVVRQQLATARAAGAEPSIINALVCMALRAVAVGSLEGVLAQGEPTPNALTITQRALEAEAAGPLIRDTLRGERALIEDFVRAVDEGRVTSDQADEYDGPAPAITGVRTIDLWIHRLRGGGWRKRKATELIRFNTALIEMTKESADALDKPGSDGAAAKARVSSTVRNQWAVDKMLEADFRSRALLRSAAAAVAAERFRQDKGRWPVSRDELAPDYLKAVPRDPDDGQPLRLRRLADGLVVYSVGTDKADDGGSVHTTGGPAKDMGVRLWDPEHRRQSAPPKNDQPPQ
jgi:hypothetical protein